MEWVTREVNTKVKLEHELEVFFITEDHLILRFKTEKECAMVRKGGSWFMAGQLLAMEPWEPNFVPDCWPIQKIVI